eukprot:gnl/TRDRNA2_/TRDRNA2_188214_c0_seq1.p1 gnl/TRDRNA2_/TRDRNA2_188214_c0~~gnl/TRDRNA2_/TRDRNA2_188214_c0_seq1.p1  ORF type:complete len:562 (-),score=53.14 gnl/TRDRNA2_/TRDRNA2_188214_c0_seq1:138-1823(-)
MSCTKIRLLSMLPLMRLACGDAVPQGSQGLFRPIPDTPSRIGVDGVHLQANTLSHINVTWLVVFGGLIGAGVLGNYVDTRWPRRSDESKERPAAWSVAILIASYGLLIPAWFSTIFSGKSQIALMYEGVGVLFPLMHPITYRRGSYMHSLLESGNTLGLSIFASYAVMIPVIRVVLLIVGECWRFSSNPARVNFARRSISLVQAISKWASPDLFAYILLCFLLRALDSGPQPGLQPRVVSDAVLDTGFSCYTASCVLSMIAALAIKPPEVENVAQNGSDAPWALPTWKLNSLRILTFVGAASALVCLFHGLCLPAITVNVDLTRMDKLQNMTDIQDIPVATIDTMLGKEMSAADCVSHLYSWTFAKGELNSALALGLLVIFVVLFTVLDLLALVMLSCQLGSEQYQRLTPRTYFSAPRSDPAFGLERGEVPSGDVTNANSSAWLTLEVTYVLKHLSMLDVALIGTLLFALCAGPHRVPGLTVSAGVGFFWLSLAEVLHHIIFHVVDNVSRATLIPPTSLQRSQVLEDNGIIKKPEFSPNKVRRFQQLEINSMERRLRAGGA